MPAPWFALVIKNVGGSLPTLVDDDYET